MPEGKYDLRLYVMLFARDDDDFREAIECDDLYPCAQSYLKGWDWETKEEAIEKALEKDPCLQVFIYRCTKYVPTYRDWVGRSEVEAHAKYELLSQAWMDRHRQGNAPEAEGRAPEPWYDHFMYEVVDGKLVLVASTVAKV